MYAPLDGFRLGNPGPHLIRIAYNEPGEDDATVLQRVRDLLAYMTPPQLSYTTADGGFTPLMVTISSRFYQSEEGRGAVIDTIIESNPATVGVVDDRGCNALMHCLLDRVNDPLSKVAVVRQLIARSDDASLTSHQNARGGTTLMALLESNLPPNDRYAFAREIMRRMSPADFTLRTTDGLHTVLTSVTSFYHANKRDENPAEHFQFIQELMEHMDDETIGSKKGIIIIISKSPSFIIFSIFAPLARLFFTL